MSDTAALIWQRFEALDPVLDEQARRRFVAAEARALGHGGVTLVSKVTGIAHSTINRGIAEIEENRSAGAGRVRRQGGGRRAKTQAESDASRRSAKAPRSFDEGRSDVAAAVDIQEPRQVVRRLERHAAQRLS